MHRACKYNIEVNVYVLEDLVHYSLLSASLSKGVHFRFQTVKQSYYVLDYNIQFTQTFFYMYRKRQCQKLKYGPREETSKNGVYKSR